MRRNFKLLVIVIAAKIILCGCNHNVINYGDGLGFDAGINPSSGMLSMNLRYGKILTAVVRDNVELDLSGNAGADGGGDAEGQALVNSHGNLSIKINRCADNK